jgi:hypothetical protein
MLLSLYFDKIVICSDNILAFTRFLTKDVVSAVVMSSWFTDLVEQGIIVLAGWGASLNADMMQNQAEYSLVYRPELKDQRYVNYLRGLTKSALWVVREPGTGEREHIDYLRPLVLRNEGVFDSREVEFLTDLLDETQETVGYVGTMELFPFIDALYGTDAQKSDAFFNAYYTSWHSYCAVHYAPAIPIHTSRIRLPLAKVALASQQTPALATVYSPDVFQRFLVRRFGAGLVSRLLAVDVKRLMAIRNGDWSRFKSRYHEHLSAASKICWVAFHPRAHELLLDERIIDDLLADIFRGSGKDTDLSALGSAIDVVFGVAAGFTFLTPAFALFKKQINTRLGRVADAVFNRDLEPYLRKLRRVLEAPIGEFAIA